MADLNQGIKYTIEADASKAEKTLQDVGKLSAENGQQIEKAMAGANAVTSALQGNFVGAIASLGRMTKAVSGLGKVIAGATGWIAIVGAVVAVFRKWRDSIAEAKEKFEQFKQVKFERHLADMKKAQSELKEEIDKTIAAIDKQLDADTRALDIAKERIKAQIELNRQKDLEGKSDAEKEKINRDANAQLANAEREAASAKIAAQIAAAGNRTEQLKKLLAKHEDQSGFRQRAYSHSVGEYQKIESDELERMVNERTADLQQQINTLKSQKLTQFGVSEEQRNKEIADREKELSIRKRDYRQRLPNSRAYQERLSENSSYAAAKKRAAELGAVVSGDLDSKDRIRTAIADSIAKQKELAAQNEIEKVKQQAAVQAERNVQAELGKVRLDEGKKQAKELAAAQQGYLVANERQKSAEQRLAAAQSAVQRAWGWYRDKDSMKAQMEEEKANAEAERQFERDFDKLKFRRDWRKAKNLSVDEEATRRVALAKEEEAAAQKAVLETAENTQRAADAVEAIRAAIEGADNVD